MKKSTPIDRWLAALFCLFAARAQISATAIPGASVTPIATPDGAFPTFQAAGASGEAYYSDGSFPRITRVSGGGELADLPIPSPASETLIASGIAFGPDGNLWFALQRRVAGGVSETRIGRMTPAGTDFTSFALPSGAANSANSQARERITVGPDGNLWFTESNASKVGRITVSGTVTEFSVRAGSFPNDIATGPDGNLWVTLELAMRIARVTTAGEVTEFAVPTASLPFSQPNRISRGPDGSLYFTDNAVNAIWRITTAGALGSFPIPTPGSNPNGICFAPDGRFVYFTERTPNRIARLDPATGTIEEVSLPSPGFPHEISLAFTPPSSPTYSFLIDSPKLFRMDVPAAPGPSGPVLQLRSSVADVGSESSAELHPAPGAIFEYTLVLSNTGNRDSARDAVVSFPLPPAVELVSAPGCSLSSATLLCPAGAAIAAGEDRTFRVFVRVRPGPPREVTAAAYVFGGGDPTTPHRAAAPAVVTAAGSKASCAADTRTLCLNGGRFEVRVGWEATHLGTRGPGFAVSLTADTGYFWFFSESNIELVLKVLDGRPVNGKFWVFYGALSNVKYTVTVTDTQTGIVRTYVNPQDTQASVADTSAF